MRKIVYILFVLVLLLVWFSNKKTTKESSILDDVEAKTKTESVSEISDADIEDSLEDDGRSAYDSVALSILKDDALIKPFRKIRGYIFDKSSDGRLLLMTINEGGTMTTGTSYVLYKRNSGKCIIKRVACPKQCDEGGMEFPAEYTRIKSWKKGYRLIGTFSFGGTPFDTLYNDTMYLSRHYLESDKDIVNQSSKKK